MSVREELFRLQPDSLDAFIIDKFPEVYGEIVGWMGKNDRITLLFKRMHENHGDQDLPRISAAYYDWLDTRPGAARTRLLVLMPSPDGVVPTCAAAEVGVIREALKTSRHGRLVDTHERTFVTVHLLHEAIAELRPHAIHIAAHGNPTGLIVQDGRGNPVIMTPADLVDTIRNANARFEQTTKPPRIVTMTVCFSDQHAVAVAKSFQCAVGAAGILLETTALAFDDIYYRSLGDGECVAVAFAKACAGVATAQRNVPRLEEHDRLTTAADTYLVKRR